MAEKRERKVLGLFIVALHNSLDFHHQLRYWDGWVSKWTMTASLFDCHNREVRPHSSDCHRYVHTRVENILL